MVCEPNVDYVPWRDEVPEIEFGWIGYISTQEVSTPYLHGHETVFGFMLLD